MAETGATGDKPATETLTNIVEGEIQTLAKGLQFTEGPVWMPQGYLVFSDIPANKMMRWQPDEEVTVFREPSGNSNGLTLNKGNQIIACEHGERRVSLTRVDGSTETLAHEYDDLTLNSPNDVVVHSSGRIYFTDPDYGLEGRKKEQPCNGVYCIDTNGRLRRIIKDLHKPNGLAFSPDEKILYVADTEQNFIKAYDVEEDGSVTNGRKFCNVPWPDGFKVDVKGRIFTSSADGIHVFEPDGRDLGAIRVPEMPANCAFGGSDRRTLFITAQHGLYSIRVKAPGIAAGHW